MRIIFDSVLVLAIAVVIGLGSAWHMIDEGSALTTGTIGPWSVWHSAGNPDADPYTRAHIARSGRLPITSTSAAYYFAETDDDGRTLVSDCQYILEGQAFNAAWWSLTLYDETGRLVANKARRHAFSDRELTLSRDGRYRIVLGRDVRPGDWLPSGLKDKRLKLVIRVYGPRDDGGPGRTNNNLERLPAIARESCGS